MELAANTTFRRPTLARTSAVIGGTAWLALPLLVGGTRPAAGSIEHLFLLMPLVAAPLALALVSELRSEDGDALLRLARSLQPAAAALLLVSFMLPTGKTAGILSLPWLGMALAVAASGVTQVARRRCPGSIAASLIGAQSFLAIGAVWLLLWRLGTGPRSFSPLMVSLAALHFHFNGFTAQVLIAATGRRVTAASTWLRTLHRVVTAAAIGGLPLLALGKALFLPVVRMAGVAAMTVALIGLAVTTIAVAMAARSAVTRALLVVSAASGAAAVGLASAFGAGEFVHREWISVGTMLGVHGALMALGFTLCGIAGHLRLQRA